MSKSSSSSDGLLSQHSHICPPPSCVHPRTQKEAVSKERTIPKGKMKKKGVLVVSVMVVAPENGEGEVQIPGWGQGPKEMS